MYFIELLGKLTPWLIGAGILLAGFYSFNAWRENASAKDKKDTSEFHKALFKIWVSFIVVAVVLILCVTVVPEIINRISGDAGSSLSLPAL